MSKGKSSILEQAVRTFKSDLPKLLETHTRQWVAYHGAKQLGFGDSKAELMEGFVNQGYKQEELYIRMVQPDIPPTRATWLYRSRLIIK